jgi:nucleotide-binding universal stress UspA family protein
MSERETYVIGREARRDVTGRSQRPRRHEEALLRYLGGVRYVEERLHERADTASSHEPGAHDVAGTVSTAATATDQRAEPTAAATRERLVVVGVDDSPGSFVALDHAAIEADLRGWPLRVVHVQYATGEGASVEHKRDRNAALLQEMSDRVRCRAPAIAVTSELSVGSAAALLVARSVAAGLLVVGSRGRGGFTSVLAGSVSTQIAAHAEGPVLVVRVPAWPPSREWPNLPVVVGVDGSAGGEAAVRFAAEEAQLRAVPLLAVYAIGARDDGTDRADHLARVSLDEAERSGRLVIRRRAVVGDPREVLIEASRRAAAVVVGSRGGGGFTGLRLGSVSQAVIRQAHCPVFVVHP